MRKFPALWGFRPEKDTCTDNAMKTVFMQCRQQL
jgi:hypothetical protein